MRANEDSPYFRPLAQLAVMSFGPPLVVGEEFGGLAGVSQVFIYGSWAAQYAGGPAPRDVDVLLIGAPDRDVSYEAARRAGERLGREVNITIRNAHQWHSASDGFTRQLRAAPLLEIPRQVKGDRDVGRE